MYISRHLFLFHCADSSLLPFFELFQNKFFGQSSVCMQFNSWTLSLVLYCVSLTDKKITCRTKRLGHKKEMRGTQIIVHRPYLQKF